MRVIFRARTGVATRTRAIVLVVLYVGVLVPYTYICYVASAYATARLEERESCGQQQTLINSLPLRVVLVVQTLAHTHTQMMCNSVADGFLYTTTTTHSNHHNATHHQPASGIADAAACAAPSVAATESPPFRNQQQPRAVVRSCAIIKTTRHRRCRRRFHDRIDVEQRQQQHIVADAVVVDTGDDAADWQHCRHGAVADVGHPDCGDAHRVRLADCRFDCVR